MSSQAGCTALPPRLKGPGSGVHSMNFWPLVPKRNVRTVQSRESGLILIFGGGDNVADAGCVARYELRNLRRSSVQSRIASLVMSVLLCLGGTAAHAQTALPKDSDRIASDQMWCQQFYILEAPCSQCPWEVYPYGACIYNLPPGRPGYCCHSVEIPCSWGCGVVYATWPCDSCTSNSSGATCTPLGQEEFCPTDSLVELAAGMGIYAASIDILSCNQEYVPLLNFKKPGRNKT